MGIAELIASCHTFAQAQLSHDLTFREDTVAGLASEERRLRDVTERGVEDVYEREWIGKVADFTDGTFPDAHDKVEIAGTRYYVEQAAPSPEGVGVTLRLRRKARVQGG